MAAMSSGSPPDSMIVFGRPILRARLQRNVHQLPGRMTEGHDVVVGVWSMFFAHANGDRAAVISRDSERQRSAAAAASLPSSFTANSMTFFRRFTTYPTHSFGTPAPYTTALRTSSHSPLPKRDRRATVIEELLRVNPPRGAREHFRRGTGARRLFLLVPTHVQTRKVLEHLLQNIRPQTFFEHVDDCHRLGLQRAFDARGERLRRAPGGGVLARVLATARQSSPRDSRGAVMSRRRPYAR